MSKLRKHNKLIDDCDIEDDKEDFDTLKTFEPDMLMDGVDYAITINPDDEHQFYQSKNRLKDFSTYWITYHFKKLAHSANLIMMLEVSNPSNNSHNRLHFHGVIRFTTVGIYKWFIYNRNALVKISQVKIYPIKNAETWFNYMTKNERTMRGLSEYYNIDYPIFFIYSNYIYASKIANTKAQPETPTEVCFKVRSKKDDSL